MFCRQNHFGLVADGRRVSDVSLGRFSLVSSDGVISDVQNRSLCLDSLCTPTVWLLMPIRSLIALSFILASGKFSEENATLQIIMIQTVHEKHLRARGVFAHLHPQSPKENMIFPSARMTQALHRRGWLWHVLDMKVSRQWRSARLCVEHTGIQRIAKE